ncbi:sigma-70 family RNA polymerase sigma factor [Flexivirga meconopsidis]|uniref:sigma-70 family RNA polymerase sigma factor n=1 Tax=Flexivirga meconopsidis TaxID=2977121 RepID=UPI00223F21C7|nr:sigma-70 family RNA polymerase sigma factor [Flexivirga meconopsidis]
MSELDETTVFLAERPRLARMAERILGDHAEAEDVVQNAWLRLDRNDASIDNLPGWLTTVTTRLCLDRLRARTPLPEAEIEPDDSVPDPADEIALADTVGIALQVVLDRLTPAERVAFVMHDTFGVEFATIAQILDSSPAAARKLASRARAKVALPSSTTPVSDAAVVDAFLAAAKGGDFGRLMQLLAPDAVIAGDELAVALGTPARITGAKDVATMFNGAAQTAFPVYVEGRPGAAWLHRGEFKVAFDFTIADGRVQRIDFRAAPEVLATVARRS